MAGDRELLEQLSDHFNARDMVAVLATMHADLAGNMLFDAMGLHVFQIDGGLIRRFDIG
jgi:hypothetical protein